MKSYANTFHNAFLTKYKKQTYLVRFNEWRFTYENHSKPIVFRPPGSLDFRPAKGDGLNRRDNIAGLIFDHEMMGQHCMVISILIQ
jgi:hypothetical protein